MLSAFSLLMSKEGLKEKETELFSFPFLLSSFSVCVVGWYREVTWVRKDMIEFLGCSCFLSAFEASSGSNRKHGLLGLSAPGLPSPRRHTLTKFWLWVLLNSHASCISQNSVTTRHPQHCLWTGQQGRGQGAHPHGTHVLCSWHTPLSHPTSLKSTISKMKLLTISRRWKQSIKPSTGASWGQSPEDHPCPMELVLPEGFSGI